MLLQTAAGLRIASGKAAKSTNLGGMFLPHVELGMQVGPEILALAMGLVDNAPVAAVALDSQPLVRLVVVVAAMVAPTATANMGAILSVMTTVSGAVVATPAATPIPRGLVLLLLARSFLACRATYRAVIFLPVAKHVRVLVTRTAAALSILARIQRVVVRQPVLGCLEVKVKGMQKAGSSEAGMLQLAAASPEGAPRSHRAAMTTGMPSALTAATLP